MKEFFDKARKIARDIDQGEYKVCSLEEAEAFAEKRKASAYKLADEVMEHYNAEKQKGFNVNWMQEVSNMLRHQADYIAQLEKGLESSIAMNKALIERDK